MKKLIASLLLLLPAFGFAMDAEHVGTYAVIHKDGHVTDFTFYTALAGGKWNIEQKNKDGSWTNVTCEQGCILEDSSSEKVATFIPDAILQKHSFTCIHNSAFAFCFYTLKSNPNQVGHAMIALETRPPTPIFLKKISNARE